MWWTEALMIQIQLSGWSMQDSVLRKCKRRGRSTALMDVPLVLARAEVVLELE
jgi:hypothetical protein